MACDICGKTDTEQLEIILDIYQTKHVKALCSSCSTMLNRELGRIRKVYGERQRIYLKAFALGKRRAHQK